jgi:hypothetical protein
VAGQKTGAVTMAGKCRKVGQGRRMGHRRDIRSVG